MPERAALLVEDVFLREPMRQSVLRFPFQLRFLFASDPGMQVPIQEEWLRLTHTLLCKPKPMKISLISPQSHY